MRRYIQIALALVSALILASGLTTPVISGTTGIISGVVTDTDTGEGLAGVNIFIDGTKLTTVTNQNGYFAVTNVPPGEYSVTASLVGYGDIRLSKLSVLMDVTSRVDIGMALTVVEDEEIVVVEARPSIQRDAIPTMYIVDSKSEQMTKSQPNLLYQAPGVVGTQPGIVRDAGGTPYIRGGRADQIAWTIDGIPVYDPVSNGYGTNLVTVGMDKMEIFTGGYRPEYGNAISGVLNEVVKTGRNAPGTAIQTMAGGQSFRGIYPEFGGANDKFDYYVGAYLWRSDLEEFLFNRVKSADTIGKFNYHLDGKNTLTFLTAQGSEEYLLPSEHTETFRDGALVTVPATRDKQNQSHLLAALTWTHSLNSSSFVTLRPYYFRSRQSLDGIGHSDGAGWWSDSESATTGLKLDYTNQATPKHLVKTGAILMSSNNRYEAIVPYLKSYFPGIGDYHYTANADSKQVGVYLQDQINMGRRWDMEIGLRYDRMKYDKVANPDSDESQTSPRIGFSYLANADNRLKFSWGKMIQFARTQAVERNYTDPTWVSIIGLENADLKAERATQFDLGWERRMGDYSLQVTPFYRKFENLLQSRLVDPTDPYGPTLFENLGEGDSKGVELLLKRNLSKNLSGWLAYTYMKAKAQSSNDRETVEPGSTRYVDWDQRHTAVMVLNYLRGSWTYNLTGEFGSGLPWGEDNSQRAASNMVFHLNFSREVKGGLLPEGQINLSVANLFNTHSVLDREPIYDPATYAVIGYDPSAYVAPRFVSVSYLRRF